MSMISELIEELIDNADLYTKEMHDLMYRAAETIEMLSEKAREPKRGEWVALNDSDTGGYWKCSVCGTPTEAYGAYTIYKFCPFCGACMRGKDNERRAD